MSNHCDIFRSINDPNLENPNNQEITNPASENSKNEENSDPKMMISSKNEENSDPEMMTNSKNEYLSTNFEIETAGQTMYQKENSKIEITTPKLCQNGTAAIENQTQTTNEQSELTSTKNQPKNDLKLDKPYVIADLTPSGNALNDKPLPSNIANPDSDLNSRLERKNDDPKVIETATIEQESICSLVKNSDWANVSLEDLLDDPSFFEGVLLGSDLKKQTTDQTFTTGVESELTKNTPSGTTQIDDKRQPSQTQNGDCLDLEKTDSSTRVEKLPQSKNLSLDKQIEEETGKEEKENFDKKQFGNSIMKKVDGKDALKNVQNNTRMVPPTLVIKTNSNEPISSTLVQCRYCTYRTNHSVVLRSHVLRNHKNEVKPSRDLPTVKNNNQTMEVIQKKCVPATPTHNPQTIKTVELAKAIVEIKKSPLLNTPNTTKKNLISPLTAKKIEIIRQTNKQQSKLNYQTPQSIGKISQTSQNVKSNINRNRKLSYFVTLEDANKCKRTVVIEREYNQQPQPSNLLIRNTAISPLIGKQKPLNESISLLRKNQINLKQKESIENKKEKSEDTTSTVQFVTNKTYSTPLFILLKRKTEIGPGYNNSIMLFPPESKMIFPQTKKDEMEKEKVGFKTTDNIKISDVHTISNQENPNTNSFEDHSSTDSVEENQISHSTEDNLSTNSTEKILSANSTEKDLTTLSSNDKGM